MSAQGAASSSSQGVGVPICHKCKHNGYMKRLEGLVKQAESKGQLPRDYQTIFDFFKLTRESLAPNPWHPKFGCDMEVEMYSNWDMHGGWTDLNATRSLLENTAYNVAKFFGVLKNEQFDTIRKVLKMIEWNLSGSRSTLEKELGKIAIMDLREVNVRRFVTLCVCCCNHEFDAEMDDTNRLDNWWRYLIDSYVIDPRFIKGWKNMKDVERMRDDLLGRGVTPETIAKLPNLDKFHYIMYSARRYTEMCLGVYLIGMENNLHSKSKEFMFSLAGLEAPAIETMCRQIYEHNFPSEKLWVKYAPKTNLRIPPMYQSIFAETGINILDPPKKRRVMHEGTRLYGVGQSFEAESLRISGRSAYTMQDDIAKDKDLKPDDYTDSEWEYTPLSSPVVAPVVAPVVVPAVPPIRPSTEEVPDPCRAESDSDDGDSLRIVKRRVNVLESDDDEQQVSAEDVSDPCRSENDDDNEPSGSASTPAAGPAQQRRCWRQLLVDSEYTLGGVFRVDLKAKHLKTVLNVLEYVRKHVMELQKQHRNEKCAKLSDSLPNGVNNGYPHVIERFMDGDTFTLPLNKVWGDTVLKALTHVRVRLSGEFSKKKKSASAGGARSKKKRER